MIMPKRPLSHSTKDFCSKTWPVLTEYSGNHLDRIFLPLGGIGTGTVSLGGRGQWVDWEVGNRPAKGYVPADTFFAIYAKPSGKPAVTRALEGSLLPDYEGARGSIQPNAGLPRFRNCKFLAAYPLGQVILSDPAMPVDVRIEAFNPLVPGDADKSGIPMISIRFVVRNKTAKKLEASICGNLSNFIGTDGKRGRATKNTNQFRSTQNGAFRGIAFLPGQIDRMNEFYGSMALMTDAPETSYRTNWMSVGWNAAVLDFWDDFSEDGVLEDRPDYGAAAPVGSVAGKLTLPANGEKAVTFLLSWHFPNRRNWAPSAVNEGTPAPNGASTCCTGEDCCPDKPSDWVGNHYCQTFKDAWDVLEKTASQFPALEKDTVAFLNDFCGSDLPDVVKEAALYNISTLRTQTSFRIAEGHLFGWEGCDDKSGCCHGSCTHVWNYENAIPFLFGDLSRSMREIEFAYATDERGMMSFRVELPLKNARAWHHAAADGQMGCLMRLYRDWKISGAQTFLERLWPHARRALEFCWIPGGWDGDKDGVMEGCQHNTMDVEYFGPNPQMEIWYLGALRACEEMALHLGETAFAATCRDLFEKGRAWTDAHLFNGEYYEHHIQLPEHPETIMPCLSAGMGSTKDFQLGAGCLVDQLVGQYMAHAVGLGYLIKPSHARKTLRSIMKYNFRKTFYGHFNPMRTYALNDEEALLMASYPHGKRPKFPFPYFAEVMTGFEYTAAVHMLQEGLEANGLKCIRAIRRRYDGKRRSPFDEAECGHHYARALASWGAVLALTGFQYSGVEASLTLNGAPGHYFWSHGAGWGTCDIKKTGKKYTVTLSVTRGELILQTLTLNGLGRQTWGKALRITPGKPLKLNFPTN